MPLNGVNGVLAFSGLYFLVVVVGFDVCATMLPGPLASKLATLYCC